MGMPCTIGVPLGQKLGPKRVHFQTMPIHIHSVFTHADIFSSLTKDSTLLIPFENDNMDVATMAEG